MLIDAKKLWVEGGYSLDNPFEKMIAGVRNHARVNHLSQEELDLILIDFFIELRSEPKKYRTKDNVCLYCSCDITNSGTNAIHYLFSQIDKRKADLINLEQERFTQALNQKIVAYMQADNEAYTEKHGPKEYKWYEIPTFKSWVGIT